MGGGTAGHVSPLLAVAEELRAGDPDSRMLFLGGRRGLEAELVPAAGIDLHRLPLDSLRDPDSRPALARAAGLLPVATFAALRRILVFRPDVCLTSGGAIAFPAVLAARLRGVPVYLWEGNLVPGRANRALARVATAVGVTFPAGDGGLAAARVSAVGTPIRRSLLRWSRSDGRAHLGLSTDEPMVLVTGGSQGSERVNEAVWSALRSLLPRAVVLHHAGRAGIAQAEARGAALPEDLRGRYRPFAFLGDELGAVLAAADLVVGRAGASSIAEPLAFGTPLVLIPFGAAMSGHQAANARAVEERGAATVVRESELSGERLAAVVLGLLSDEPRLERMRTAARALGRRDAAARIAADVLRLGGCAT